MNSRMNIFASVAMLGCGLLAMGCYAEAGTYVETQSAVVYDDSPTLVAVEPGVWVVSRQPTAIYYVNDSYWTYRGNTWYRSSDWEGSWVSVDVNIVPVTIVHRDSTRYTYYNPPRGVATRPMPPGHRATPGVRRGQTYDHNPHVRHNDVGATWQGNDDSHKHKRGKHGHGRGR